MPWHGKRPARLRCWAQEVWGNEVEIEGCTWGGQRESEGERSGERGERGRTGMIRRPTHLICFREHVRRHCFFGNTIGTSVVKVHETPVLPVESQGLQLLCDAADVVGFLHRVAPCGQDC